MDKVESLQAVSTGAKVGKKKKTWFSFSVLFILPSFILYTMFVIYPALNSVNLSFTSWDGVSPNIHYIGFDNFKEIVHSERVWNALKNTLIMSVALVVLENVIAILLAMLVDQVRWCKNLFRSIFYFPVLLSGIVMGFVWAIIFNYNFGVISQLLDRIGLGSLKIDWLGNPDYALIAIIITAVWKGAGYYMIIYLAGLQGIPQELHEAAAIDGANRWQQFRNITFPLLAGSMTVCVMLSMIGALKIFDQIAVMTDGGPGFATETLTYIVYKVGFGELRQGYGTAMSLVLFLLILIVSLIQIRVLRKREVHM
ncbi:carbohydrate ABC transporter permease [Paenibacillus whitsoniae]|uniref:Sugar ABC transporter permease n=1 Tax=Paenibacillus whitsoniae TaxID=2496558 RepID=A0A3S0BRI6_9BACL|nr:sugar ABC transporter permease [Paenibacillus whitsoniae]RTE04442.1 sugar ABC transporter permease [Paenibacillus whitsoniae]